MKDVIVTQNLTKMYGDKAAGREIFTALSEGTVPASPPH